MNRAGRGVIAVILVVLVVAAILALDSKRETPRDGTLAIASPTPVGEAAGGTPLSANASSQTDSAPADIHTARIAATPSVASPGNSPELAKLRAAATASLPTTASLRTKSEVEVHGTPVEILDAGRRIGQLAEYLETHPAEIPAALPTFSDCAGDEKVVSTVRALCTYRLKVYEKAWDPATRARFVKLPASIRDLAKQLDGT